VDTFEHVTVLSSIIIGLGLTHLLTGVVRLIQSPRRRRAYWLHIFVVGVVFVSLVSAWWLSLTLTLLAEISFPHYLYVVIYSVLQYAICVILFPLHEDAYIDFKEYYHGPGKWLFAFVAVILVVDTGDTALRGLDHLASKGPFYIPAQLGLAAWAVLALLSRREIVHVGLAIAWIAYLMSWMFGANAASPIG
jgi:hypothetical protein